METMPYTLPEFKLSEPDQALMDFCARYPQHEAQQRLWKWFILALKDSRLPITCPQNKELIAFYEDLKTLVSAVYQLHDLPGEMLPHPHEKTAPPLEATPLAEALDLLHASVDASWVLLISPPE